MNVLYFFHHLCKQCKVYIEPLFLAGCQACYPLITFTVHLYLIFTSLWGNYRRCHSLSTVFCLRRQLWEIVLRHFSEKGSSLRWAMIRLSYSISPTASRSLCPSHVVIGFLLTRGHFWGSCASGTRATVSWSHGSLLSHTVLQLYTVENVEGKKEPWPDRGYYRKCKDKLS